jgi:hypothetical protein
MEVQSPSDTHLGKGCEHLFIVFRVHLKGTE